MNISECYELVKYIIYVILKKPTTNANIISNINCVN